MGRKLLIYLVTALIFLVAISAITGCKKNEEPQKESGYNLTSEPAQSIPGRAMQKAKGVECQSNLSQIRQMIQMKIDEDKQGAYDTENPPVYNSLTDFGIPKSMTNCPVSHKPYVFENNEVRCTFQGHEKY